MASFVNACVFTAASAGTGSFVVSSAVTGWMTPAQAGAVNGATYRYRAYSSDLTQWEIGTGTYTVSSTTLTRTVTASSNANATVNFTAAPSVALTSFGADISSAVEITGGTVTGLTNLTLASGAATPATNDAAALGTTSLMWSDLFLAAGGVVNWNNGDVTITNSTNALAFAGASSGYTFDALVSPSANDAAALGSATVSWADLFLASGGVVNWANGDITITGNSNALAFAGASSGYSFDANVATTGTFTKNGNDITVGTATFIIDGGGVTITTGSKGYLTIPFGCTITQWTVVADQSGSIVIDVKRSTYSGFPTTTSIVGGSGNKPTITTSTKGQAAPSSWTSTTITAGDVLEFNVDSVTSCQRVTLSLSITRS